MSDTELYEVLEIKSDATDDQIKKAFRKMSLRYHPDKNPNAKELYEKISYARDVLLDREMRSVYDRHGQKGLDQLKESQGGQSQQPSCFRVMCSIDLETYFNSDSKEVGYNTQGPCDACQGSGFEDKVDHSCTECGGAGAVMARTQIMPGLFVPSRIVCPVCRGSRCKSGSEGKHCKKCKGLKMVMIQQFVTVPVPRDVFDNPDVMMEGAGPELDGKKLDLMVSFTINLSPKESKIFSILEEPSPHSGETVTRLVMTQEIDLASSLFGIRVPFFHPRGGKYTLSSEPNTPIHPDRFYLIEGMGLKNDDLLVKFKIKFPEHLNLGDEKIHPEDLYRLFGGKPRDSLDESTENDTIFIGNRHRELERVQAERRQQAGCVQQ